MYYIDKYTESVLYLLSRLNFSQTEFGENVSFSFKTFRFMGSGAATDEGQQQTISCDLHLEPSASVTQQQQSDCSCYTETDCAGEILFNILSVKSYDSIKCF